MASKARIKTLKILAQNPHIRLKDFLHEYGGNTAEAYRNLEIFEKAGIITNEYKQIGNRETRTIHLMVERPQTQLLLKALAILAQAESDSNNELIVKEGKVFVKQANSALASS
jgi:hypothetical protein